jgi:hypothetical protein
MERGDCYYRLLQRLNKWSIKYTIRASSTQNSYSLDIWRFNIYLRTTEAEHELFINLKPTL